MVQETVDSRLKGRYWLRCFAVLMLLLALATGVTGVSYLVRSLINAQVNLKNTYRIDWTTRIICCYLTEFGRPPDSWDEMRVSYEMINREFGGIESFEVLSTNIVVDFRGIREAFDSPEQVDLSRFRPIHTPDNSVPRWRGEDPTKELLECILRVKEHQRRQ
jgi:hypothetical protein